MAATAKGVREGGREAAGCAEKAAAVAVAAREEGAWEGAPAATAVSAGW